MALAARPCIAKSITVCRAAVCHERFGAKLAGQYPAQPGFIDLETGYYGIMSGLIPGGDLIRPTDFATEL